MEIFITRKSEKFLDLNKQNSDESDEQKWSSDVFLVDRKKCLIITHKQTLYTFFVINLTKNDLKNLNEKILNSLENQLEKDQIDLSVAQKFFVLTNESKVNFLRTDNDQKTLGWLRDILIVAKLVMDENKSEKINKLTYFAKHMNKRLVGTRKYKSPIEMLNEVL